MIDHLFAFPSEAAARAALPAYCAHGPDGVWHWDGSRVVTGVQIITAEAVWNRSDPDPFKAVLVWPEQHLPGFWIAIALPGLSPALRDLPGDVCRYISDRDAANAGAPREQFTLYLSASVDPSLLATARVSPVFAGSAYPFGG